MAPVVIVFAKAPLPGRVKTRIAAKLGDESATLLHTAFVEDLIRALAPEFHLELHADIPCDAWPALRVPRRIQIAGDLGGRMKYALEHALDRRHPVAAIVGSDVPTVPVKHVRELLSLVSSGGADVALGPSRDGGFWGIAARRLRPNMFHGVEWSTENSLRQTMTACAACSLSVALAPKWYDVDTMDDLRRLYDDPLVLERPLTRVLLESLLS